MGEVKLPKSGAVISECGRYRYALTRETGYPGGEGTVLFVMLNPSTADATTDDPTIRRCLGFARQWGYARLAVGNLFALRATDPRELLSSAVDTVGPENDSWLDQLAGGAAETIAAWGAHRAAAPERVRRVLAVVEFWGSMRCLGQTKTLAPRHPLYLRRDAARVPFRRLARA